MRNNRIWSILSIAFITVFGLVSCEEEPLTIDVTGVEISTPSIEMLLGETVQLNAVVVPSNATDSSIEWVSADNDIASVDIKGRVTAKEQGSTIIMARSGDIIAECAVNILPIEATGIDIDTECVDMKVGEKVTLKATIAPETVTDNHIHWKTSDRFIADVDEDGVVFGKSSGSVTITAQIGEYSDDCEVYVVGEPQIGDFYYPDGTWFSVPLDNKTPVGVIFYVGDPTESDLKLRDDHPECTHGLVVSLFYEKSVSWQSHAADYEKIVNDWAKEDPVASKYVPVYQKSTGDYLNSIMGYSNTLVYEMFNQDEANAAWPIDAMDRLDECREQYPLPEMTSGWYVPSIKELSLMVTGEFEGNIGNLEESALLANPMNEIYLLLNEKVFQIDGAYTFSPQYYISSTEFDKVKGRFSTTYEQWSINAKTGYVFTQNKIPRMAPLRPVFAF